MKRLIFFSCIGAFLLLSCETDFDSINENPGKLNDVEFRYLLPAAITATYFNQGQVTSVSAGFVAQYFDAEICGEIVGGRRSMDHYWQNSFFGGALKDCQTLIDKSERTGRGSYYSGVAKILMAANYGGETTLFGDLPFSEALQGNDFLNPKYDTQEAIYDGILRLLDEGIADLSGVNSDYTGGDLVFDGNAEKWIKNANALKMRFMLHLSKKRPQYIPQILELANSAIQNGGDQAIFNFGRGDSDNWSLNKLINERPFTYLIHDHFANLLESTNDPRTDKILVETFGANYFTQNQTNDIIWARADAGVPLISLSEVYFIQAELLLESNEDLNEVEDLLRNAVVANMELLEVDEADYSEYLIQSAALSESNTFEQNLEIIMTEAYKAYFGYNCKEGWTNQRRTGIPALTPPGDMMSVYNPSGGMVLRFLYPESEFQTNPEQVGLAQARQSGALLDAPLWIFKTD